jgi:hypothetical protein
MKKREWGNLGLHLGIGGALTALVMWHILFINFAVFVYASLREQAQHRYRSRENPQPGETVMVKRTFFDFGWLGWKQAFEIGQWTVGSAVVSIPWYYFG